MQSRLPLTYIDENKSTEDVKFFIVTDKFINLLAMSNSAQAFALEGAPTVPDIDMEEYQSFDSPPPSYPVNLRTVNLQAARNAGYIGIPLGTEPQEESQQNADADSEDPEYTLPSEELSFPLNFPENYDPELELIQSLQRNQNALDNSLMGRPQFEVQDVCYVEVKDVEGCHLQSVDKKFLLSNKHFRDTIPNFNVPLWDDQPMNSFEDLNESRFETR